MAGYKGNPLVPGDYCRTDATSPPEGCVNFNSSFNFFLLYLFIYFVLLYKMVK